MFRPKPDADSLLVVNFATISIARSRIRRYVEQAQWRSLRPAQAERRPDLPYRS